MPDPNPERLRALFSKGLGGKKLGLATDDLCHCVPTKTPIKAFFNLRLHTP